MTEAVFQAPKRRAKVHERFEAPLPVSVSARDEEHIIFRAEIIAHHVIVTDPAHILSLCQRGFFGKGVFSRSRPEHVISQRWKYAGDRCLPIISSSEYQRRLGWARAALLMQGLEEDAVGRALEALTKPVQLDVDSQKPEAERFSERSMDDLSCDTELNPEGDGLDQTDAARPRGDPEGPERFVKRRRADEDLTSSDACQYVLLELSEDAHRDRSTTDNASAQEQRATVECRLNPFTTMEYLQLTYEEAFFLVYALGCLSVYYSGEALSVAQVWTMFRSLQPHFSSSYAAYHYFRSKGWVPKSGVKYGTDLMLYRKGPPFYHASYSVVIQRCEESLRGAGLRSFSWRSLAALSRITGNVSKELMLCFVRAPSDLTEDVQCSPECLRLFSVQEVVVSRWVSSRERTEQEDI